MIHDDELSIPQSMPYPTIGFALSNLGFLSSIIRCRVDELEYKIHMRTMLHKNISTTHPSKNKSGHGLFPLFFQQYCQHLRLPPLGGGALLTVSATRAEVTAAAAPVDRPLFPICKTGASPEF